MIMVLYCRSKEIGQHPTHTFSFSSYRRWLMQLQKTMLTTEMVMRGGPSVKVRWSDDTVELCLTLFECSNRESPERLKLLCLLVDEVMIWVQKSESDHGACNCGMYLYIDHLGHLLKVWPKFIPSRIIQ